MTDRKLLKANIVGGGYFTPVLLAFTTLLQILIFQWACFHNLLIASLWRNPAHFFIFWGGKLGPALLLGGLALLTKRRWWTVAVVATVSLWALANLLYFRANDNFISLAAILMAGNLRGFESAIGTYWNLPATLLAVIPAAYAAALVPLHPQCSHPKTFLALLPLLVAGGMGMRYLFNRQYVSFSPPGIELQDVVPYMAESRLFLHGNCYWAEKGSSLRDNQYINYHSIVSQLPRIFVLHWSSYPMQARSLRLAPDAIPPEVGARVLADTATRPQEKPVRNLVIVLVESLESWAIDAQDDYGTPVAPRLRGLTERGLYAPRVRSQVRDGMSGDGQMILNTGLLPLQQGAAVMIFDHNHYPNLAAPYTSATTIIPTEENVWNQQNINPAYGYDTLICRITRDDEAVLAVARHHLDTLTDRPFCCQVLTISTHGPFEEHAHSGLRFRPDMPGFLADYLNCVHYADSCIGAFVDYLDSHRLLDSTDLVITGDHTVFRSNMLRDIQPAARTRGYDVLSGQNFVPLLLLSPSTEVPMHIGDTCWQADIYPTLRALVPLAHTRWLGFGRNLLDSASHRPFAEHEAYRWSELMLRSDWLRTQP